MTPRRDDIGVWYDTLDDAKADNLSPVKVISPLCFFKLIGKRTIMSVDNLEVIPNLTYCYKAEDRYYVREYRDWGLEEVYFYRPSLTFSGFSEAIEALRHRILLGYVYLLLTPEQVADISAMLVRLYSSYYKGEGKVPYRLWIELLDVSLRYEDFKANFSNQEGYRTSCKLREDKLKELWKQVKNAQK